jgi:hypothetical protein
MLDLANERAAKLLDSELQQSTEQAAKQKCLKVTIGSEVGLSISGVRATTANSIAGQCR